MNFSQFSKSIVFFFLIFNVKKTIASSKKKIYFLWHCLFLLSSNIWLSSNQPSISLFSHPSNLNLSLSFPLSLPSLLSLPLSRLAASFHSINLTQSLRLRPRIPQNSLATMLDSSTLNLHCFLLFLLFRLILLISLIWILLVLKVNLDYKSLTRS